MTIIEKENAFIALGEMQESETQRLVGAWGQDRDHRARCQSVCTRNLFVKSLSCKDCLSVLFHDMSDFDTLPHQMRVIPTASSASRERVSAHGQVTLVCARHAFRLVYYLGSGNTKYNSASGRSRSSACTPGTRRRKGEFPRKPTFIMAVPVRKKAVRSPYTLIQSRSNSACNADRVRSSSDDIVTIAGTSYDVVNVEVNGSSSTNRRNSTDLKMLWTI
ncbi:hypothetical protein EVAR_13805_1 [Eumeta japonica]|uniref:Uncharacterized protein n=1 Tax=Eumeta variegata TaxID=151549 RepID=A0A4C1U175_EUMVA|nr:hypothetical protein EVAR_13805_1 [Eumeta japonica]